MSMNHLTDDRACYVHQNHISVSLIEGTASQASRTISSRAIWHIREEARSFCQGPVIWLTPFPFDWKNGIN